MNTTILSTLLGTQVSDVSKVIKQGWQATNPYMTGCLIYTDAVYSICTGTVVEIGKDDKNNLYSVTIEYDYGIWIRYCLLQSYVVAIGDDVSSGTKMGDAYKGVLRFEYCTEEFSVFPYRTEDRQLYKHDPMPILTGEIELPEIDDDGDVEAIDEEEDYIIYIGEDTSDVEI